MGSVTRPGETPRKRQIARPRLSRLGQADIATPAAGVGAVAATQVTGGDDDSE